MRTVKDKIYMVWNNDESDFPYFEQFDSIEDALSTHGDKTEIYVAEPKYLGVFKRKSEVVKVKPRRRKKK